MAIVLALLIVGWLVAFALGAQAGFEAQPTESAQPAARSQAPEATSAGYRKPVSAS